LPAGQRRRTVPDVEQAERAIAAPPHLGLDTRTDFRRAAIECLDALPEGTGALVIDLSVTRLMDSAGLGTLILVRQHATRRRQVVRLRGASEEIRLLLVLTRLEDQFVIENPGVR
jgi:anti-anti-sigma factor